MKGAESAVEIFARELWLLRENGGGRIPADRVTVLARALARVVQAEVAACDSYDPESDRRVLWAREVLAAARRGEPRCMAGGGLEASAAFVLEMPAAIVWRCGKDAAAGDGWESEEVDG